MEQTFPNPNKTESQPRPFQLWRILRLIPITIMLLVIGILLILFLMGGLWRITAWYLLQLIPPVLGLISLIVIIIYAIVKRRFSKLLIVTSLTVLLSLLPAILLVKPVIAYPASLEST